MNTIEAKAVLKLVDQFTGPAKRVGGMSGKLEKQLGKTQKHLAHLKSDRTDIESFTRLRKQSKDTRHALEQQQTSIAKLARELKNTEKPSKKLTKEFEAAKKQAAQLKQKHASETQQLQQLRKRLNNTGISTHKLSQQNRDLAKTIDVTNKRLKSQQHMLAGYKDAVRHAQQTKHHLGNAGSAALKTGAGLVGLGWLFKRTFVDTAAEFERYETILTTIEGSRAGAIKAMDWVQNFAATTPYELDQVTDAFVKLRAYGLNPTDGLLRTLGDTASAMGKDVNQAVEAIADAVTGENERLKEFGIKARANGNKIVYEYSVNGQTKLAEALKSDRQQIQSVLSDIFNSKYAGAMDKQSRTWAGMMSNLTDQWTRFVNLVMKNGLFDWMKSELSQLLETVNTMAKTGALEQRARTIATQLKTFFGEMWQAAKAILALMRAVARVLNAAADALGGWNNLAWVMIGLPVASSLMGIVISVTKLFTSFGLLSGMLPLVGKGLLWIGRALMLNPIGLAITAIAGGAYLIIKYWQPIKAWFANLWQGIENVFFSFHPLGILMQQWNPAMSWWQNLLQGFSTAASNIWQSITGVFYRGIASLLKAIQKATSLLPDWALPDAIGGKNLDVAIRHYQQRAGTDKATTNKIIKPGVAAPLKAAGNNTIQQTTEIYSPITIQKADGLDEDKIAELIVRKQRQQQRDAERKSRGRLHGE
ncbi:Chromosome partition protein Smc [BD1-7 clade bacterium]|uniref:Chromosome partition protein Smc n=1 Tax=BD1-7 clade bacterium TaxID=2029982 RepID=A0A5S9QW93_9GAMM|nr:Chromosome partition protein Smc [BD1-7 clade bacterium]CAA0122814.1 Chromosome partition protein Smc [BD1-7 clade bacterium]